MELLCRLCGDPKSKDQIKCTIRDKSLEIEQKLIDCCRWHSYQDSENLPENVCLSCFECLQQSWRFCEAVANAQKKLCDSFYNKQKLVKAQSPTNISIDVDIKDELFDDYESMNVFDNWCNDDSSENEFKFKVDSLVVDNLPEISDDVDSILNVQRKPIVTDEPLSELIKEPIALQSTEKNSNGTYEDETLENYTKYKINFLDSLMPDDRNLDGTVKEGAISRLKLGNWSIFQHQCNECHLCFIDALGLTRHHKKEHSHLPLRFKCWLCRDAAETRSYSKRSVLFRHIVRHHIPYLAYCCKSCNKYYWDLKLLKKHRPNRTGCIRDIVKMSIICEQCGEIFSSESNLRSHQYVRHTPNELRTVYECYVCRATFHTIVRLKYHMWQHAGPKLIECTICHKMFNNKSHSRHFKTHLDIMPFSCSYCGKRFKFANRVRIHERIHTGERPYKCKAENCDYRCSDRGNIYKHMRQKHKMVFRK